MEENIDNENDIVSFENVFEKVENSIAFTNRDLLLSYYIIYY